MTAILLAFALCVSAGAAPDDGGRMGASAQAELKRQRLAGLAAGVVSDGEIAFLGGWGWEDAEARVPVDPRRTLFRWASVSKTLAAAAALRAAERGVLDLDADVRRVCPDCLASSSYAAAGALAVLPSTATVTVRMLLAHSAGVPHYDNGIRPIPEPPAAVTASSSTNTGIAWALKYWNTEPLIGYPGRVYRYSSYGYNLAGAVLERAAGRPFWELVRDDLARPLGLETLRPDFIWEGLPRRAVGYTAVSASGTWTRAEDVDASWKLPAGGFISTVEDMARWCGALMGERALSERLKGEAWRPAADPEYGLGFMLGRLRGRRWVGHSGGQEKVSAFLMLLPEERLCAVAATNSSHGKARPVVEGLLRAALKARARR